MTDKAKSIDWSDNNYKEMLVYQRKFMWREDSIEMISKMAGT